MHGQKVALEGSCKKLLSDWKLKAGSLSDPLFLLQYGKNANPGCYMYKLTSV